MKRQMQQTFVQSRDGVAVLEFALVVPVLLTIFAGLSDFLLAFSDRIQLASGVAGGAAYAFNQGQNVSGTAQAVSAADVKAKIVSSINLPNVSVTVTGPSLGCISNSSTVPPAATLTAATAGTACPNGQPPGDVCGHNGVLYLQPDDAVLQHTLQHRADGERRGEAVLNGRKPASRFRLARQGNVALEFAIMAGIFLSLVVGGMDVGLLWWAKNSLQVTAAMTARCMALGSCADPAAYAAQMAGNWTVAGAISASNVTLSTTSQCFGTGGSYSQFSMVTITSPFWAGLPPPLPHIALQASACYPAQL